MPKTKMRFQAGENGGGSEDLLRAKRLSRRAKQASRKARLCRKTLLFAQIQRFENPLVPFVLRTTQVVEQSASIVNHLEQAAAGRVILVVRLQVLSELVDATRQQSDLDRRAPGILIVEL